MQRYVRRVRRFIHHVVECLHPCRARVLNTYTHTRTCTHVRHSHVVRISVPPTSPPCAHDSKRAPRPHGDHARQPRTPASSRNIVADTSGKYALTDTPRTRRPHPRSSERTVQPMLSAKSYPGNVRYDLTAHVPHRLPRSPTGRQPTRQAYPPHFTCPQGGGPTPPEAYMTQRTTFSARHSGVTARDGARRQ